MIHQISAMKVKTFPGTSKLYAGTSKFEVLGQDNWLITIAGT